jgi:putative flippase GtrA
MKKIIMQYLRLCIVGATGMLVQIVSFNILRHYWSPVWSIQLAIVLAMVTNFYAHGRFTFSEQTQSWKAIIGTKGVLFFSYSLLMLFLQGQWLRYGVMYFGSSVWIENCLMFLGMGWGSCLNLLFYSRFIWPKKIAS